MAVTAVLKNAALPLLLLASRSAAMCTQLVPIGNATYRVDTTQTLAASSGFTCSGSSCCNVAAQGWIRVHGTQNLTDGVGPEWLYSMAQDVFFDDVGGTSAAVIMGTTACSYEFATSSVYNYCVPPGQSGHVTLAPRMECRVGTVKGCEGSDRSYEGTSVEVCGLTNLNMDVYGTYWPNMQVGFAQTSKVLADAMTDNPAENATCNAQTYPHKSGAMRAIGASFGGLTLALAVTVTFGSLV